MKENLSTKEKCASTWLGGGCCIMCRSVVPYALPRQFFTGYQGPGVAFTLEEVSLLPGGGGGKGVEPLNLRWLESKTKFASPSHSLS